jgi:hypothetical protein
VQDQVYLLRSPISRTYFGIAVTIIVIEGVALAASLRENKKVVRRSTFMRSVMERHCIDFDEFETIVATELGLLKSKNQERDED